MSQPKSSVGRHGQLNLSFVHRGARTVMTENFCRVPLQVLKPWYHESGCACVYVLSPSGGVVQGDNYRIKLNLARQSHVLLTTLAATKIYGMSTCGAQQNTEVHVGEGATFEYLPAPTILFRDADFNQSFSLFLQDGAKAVVQDIVMPGRIARGEVLEFRRYRNLVEISDQDGLISFDSSCLRPQFQSHLTNIGILEGYSCWGSWCLVGDFEIDQLKWEALCEFAEPMLNCSDQSVGGISKLHRNGIAMRMLAHNAARIQFAFESVWNWIKLEICDMQPIDLRKY